MTATLTTPRPATVRRPTWTELPPGVRHEINRRLHQPVVDAASAHTGYTPAFASVLHLADDTRVFCKAAPEHSTAAHWYDTEAMLSGRLPLRVAAPRYRWHTRTEEYVIACYDAIDATPPDPTLPIGQLAAIRAAHAITATALTGAATPLRALAAQQPPLPAGWLSIATGRRVLPPAAGDLLRRAPLLACWEHTFLTQCATGSELAHFDLRPDNTLLNGQRAWIVDWATLRPGPAWVDTAILAVTAIDHAYDPDELFFTHPTARTATDRDLDGVLAWMAGAWLTHAARPPRPGSPGLREHQLRHGLLTWNWLAHRHGLTPIPPP